MKKLSKINEGLWMDSIKRANSNIIRKEENLHIDDILSYIDGKRIPKITIRIENGQQIIDVKGSFVFKPNSCKNGKLPFKFGNVTKNFSCSDNNLKSLEGCPETVGGNFYCENNILNSIEGSPKTVGGDFYCYKNDLESLKGCPETVGGNFYCYANPVLNSLEGIGKVKGYVSSDIIKESLWMDSIKRANSNEVRMEDLLHMAEDYLNDWMPSNYTKPIFSIRTENGQRLVDVNGSYKLKDNSIKDGKFPFKFGKVTENFDCGHDNNLKSLEGCPEYVGGNFSCCVNKELKSLEGGPKVVKGNYYCLNNGINTLKGAPNEVGGDFSCNGSNDLHSLKYCPKKVGRDFSCYGTHLDSLEGGPEEVGRTFDCKHSHLKSLKGAPKKVNATFMCSENEFENLEGSPEYVCGDFYCDNNKNLTSLKGAPKKVTKCFICKDTNLPDDYDFSHLNVGNKIIK